MKNFCISLTVAGMAFLAISARAQDSKPRPETKPASSQAAASPSTSADANHKSEAYFNFAMGHAEEEEFELTGRSENANQAVEYYKKALELDPESSVIIERLAETYAKSQHIQDAVHEAEAAIKANPDNPGPHRLLARIYVRNLGDLSAGSGQRDVIDKAVEQFREILRIDPKDSQSALWLARLYRFENEHDKAEQTLREVLRWDPTNEGALEQLSQLLMDEGRAADAIELLNKAAAQSTSSTLYDLLGDAYAQTHEYAKSEEAYKKAVEGDPDEASHRKGLAQALLTEEKFPQALEEYKRLADLEPENPDNYLRLSQIYRHMNKFDLAESNIVRAKELAPGNLEVTYNEALLYDAQGRFDDAAHVLADAIAGITGQGDNGGSPNALAILYEELGRIYREKEDYASAEHSYEELGKLGPEESRRAQMLLIDTYRESHEIDRAISETQKALKENDKDRGLTVTYAILLGEKEQTEEAEKVLRGLLKHNAEDQEVYLDLAQVEERGRHYADAEQSAMKAEELAGGAPEKEAAWFMLGAIYEREKKFELSEAEFKKALESDPKNAAVLNYYGYMLADRGVRLEEATNMIHQALAQEPSNGAYLDSMGWVYYKQNKLAEAEEYLKKAVDRSAHDPTILGHLGDVYAKMGRTERAAALWEKALAEWQHALPADYEADRVSELDQRLKNLKHSKVAEKPAPQDTKPQ
ncbi:MAG: tetratricopeptide repeat protein [Candidatus Acidiferrales bacterium]